MTAPLVTVDVVGTSIELTVWPAPDAGGLSVLLRPEEWASIASQAEQLAPVQEYRQREARLGHSHQVRASRKDS